ncbi:hypothetical protein [Mammaliicoccus sciuri]|uniref:hypothetical protein n=1 Tax=Mammaliicoccus sciuri TaxID=1296 RepID=UPI002B25E5D2|nr:hypothetical protein [Mammaliicoccus sciuri]WQK62725.1 hypothetical protein P3U20_11015 [Mammaliicoccus sciuri]
MKAIMNFESFRIKKIDYLVNNMNDRNESNDSASLTLNAGTSEIDEEGTARLELELNIEDKGLDYDRTIKVVVIAIFNFENSESTSNEYLENLLRINGTAIVLPYIRSLISNLTGFDNSTDHVLLPALNVEGMFKE